jgi:plasmid maintenance system antidote protein VapI
MWLNLQNLYELRLTEQQSGEQIKNTIARRQPSQERQAADLYL